MHIEFSEGKTIPVSWMVPEATLEAHLSVSVGLGKSLVQKQSPVTCMFSKFSGGEVSMIMILKAKYRKEKCDEAKPSTKGKRAVIAHDDLTNFHSGISRKKKLV
jgi:hypothetical protein